MEELDELDRAMMVKETAMAAVLEREDELKKIREGFLPTTHKVCHD